MGQLLFNMDHSLLKLATSGLILVLAAFSSGAATDGDCFSILEQSQVLSATYPKRIAHGIHSLTLADLRHYFNPKASETNNVPTINRNLSSSVPILNDAPDIGRSNRFQTMGLLVAEEVVLNEDRDWDMHNADILGKFLHALHMHEMWTETSRVYQTLLANPPTEPNFCPCLVDVENNGIYFHLRKIAMLIREPELAYNTENKRIPRGGRQYSYCSKIVCCGLGLCPCGNCGGGGGGGPSYAHGKLGPPPGPHPQQKRAAEKEGHEDLAIEEKSDHSKAYWVDLFNGFAEMTDPVSSDLALYLYCMLN